MKIGFIGAGKVGFSLGKYLQNNSNQNNVEIVGYFSKSLKSAKSAADFTNTKLYTNLEYILKDSDTLFLTVPDGSISQIWDYMRNLDIRNKNICHCSGSISSTAFFDAQNKGAYAYSIHPLCAINDRYEAYKNLANAPDYKILIIHKFHYTLSLKVPLFYFITFFQEFLSQVIQAHFLLYPPRLW